MSFDDKMIFPRHFFALPDVLQSFTSDELLELYEEAQRSNDHQKMEIVILQQQAIAESSRDNYKGAYDKLKHLVISSSYSPQAVELLIRATLHFSNEILSHGSVSESNMDFVYEILNVAKQKYTSR
ncbi:hypothetical protein KIPB_014189 [Kipferlia bialata]|uniref:Uncharacterized protein n=1 Tax=Kipferlia bialata TaxID=797122 RepID=A0A391NV23_9EUKA|nr:hypothetical protein KIPB_014189 [Kipferlia bialata]|eukprot:g14189.t1